MYIFITPPRLAFCNARGRERGGRTRALLPPQIRFSGCRSSGRARSSEPRSRPRAERPPPPPPPSLPSFLPPAGSMARAAALASSVEAVLGSRSNANRVFEILELLAVRGGGGDGRPVGRRWGLRAAARSEPRCGAALGRPASPPASGTRSSPGPGGGGGGGPLRRPDLQPALRGAAGAEGAVRGPAARRGGLSRR